VVEAVEQLIQLDYQAAQVVVERMLQVLVVQVTPLLQHQVKVIMVVLLTVLEAEVVEQVR
jgi:hypothetical protein